MRRAGAPADTGGVANSSTGSSGGQRIDKWLWCARFFKTRSQAALAVSGGHAHINGQRVKPSKLVTTGQVLTITRGTLTFEVTVVGLATRRGPAPEAQALYSETAQSIAKREAQTRQSKEQGAGFSRPLGRPNKRDRRHLTQMKQQPRDLS
ncbi:MAG: RNA-binding protein [Chromatiales bacterium]|jgi:ribosome-associated heat shock protein Hsp15|nr:RNA-binding protein [Chromatiales bacterium]